VLNCDNQLFVKIQNPNHQTYHLKDGDAWDAGMIGSKRTGPIGVPVAQETS
jgi:hypothetical protein